MEIPQWEDKTPKENKVEDGRLVRPFEQTVRKHPEVGKLKDVVTELLAKVQEQAVQDSEKVVPQNAAERRHVLFGELAARWRDKDARPE